MSPRIWKLWWFLLAAAPAAAGNGGPWERLVVGLLVYGFPLLVFASPFLIGIWMLCRVRVERSELEPEWKIIK